MAGTCHGNGVDHCCYVNGERCQFLEEHTVEGRRWVCGLRVELGSWDEVEQDQRWQQVVGRYFLDPTKGRDTFTCGSWPWALDEAVLHAGGPALCCFGGENPEVSCLKAECAHEGAA